MSGNGPPAHRAAGPVQRNRLIAVGAGLLLALILLFSVLALCSNQGGDDPPAAGPASSLQVSHGAPASGTSSPGVSSPGASGPEPGVTTPGGAGTGPSAGGSVTVVPPGTDGTGAPATAGPTGEAETTADPERSPTPSGGVDAGGGGLVPGRRLALLVTGGFLLLAAGAAGTYALRRPLHHR